MHISRHQAAFCSYCSQRGPSNVMNENSPKLNDWPGLFGSGTRSRHLEPAPEEQNPCKWYLNVDEKVPCCCSLKYYWLQWRYLMLYSCEGQYDWAAEKWRFITTVSGQLRTFQTSFPAAWQDRSGKVSQVTPAFLWCLWAGAWRRAEARNSTVPDSEGSRIYRIHIILWN